MTLKLRYTRVLISSRLGKSNKTECQVRIFTLNSRIL